MTIRVGPTDQNRDQSGDDAGQGEESKQRSDEHVALFNHTTCAGNKGCCAEIGCPLTDYEPVAETAIRERRTPTNSATAPRRTRAVEEGSGTTAPFAAIV